MIRQQPFDNRSVYPAGLHDSSYVFGSIHLYPYPQALVCLAVTLFCSWTTLLCYRENSSYRGQFSYYSINLGRKSILDLTLKTVCINYLVASTLLSM